MCVGRELCCGKLELYHSTVHTELWKKIYVIAVGVHNALTSVTGGGNEPVLYVGKVGSVGRYAYGDILTVNSGEVECAAQLFEILVNRYQNGSGVRACDNTRVFFCVDIDNIVKIYVLDVACVKTEVGHKTETEAVGFLFVK